MGDHTKIIDAPATIWLNYGDIERDCTHAECYRDGDVTWCQEPVFDSDVKYIRADRIAELEALNIGLMEANDEALKQVKASASREAALVEALKLSEAVLAATQEVYGACLGPKTHEGINAALAKIKEAS